MAAVEAQTNIVSMGEDRAPLELAQEEAPPGLLDGWDLAPQIEEENEIDEAPQSFQQLEVPESGEAAVGGVVSTEYIETCEEDNTDSRGLGDVKQDLFPEEEEEDDDGSSSSDYGSHHRPGTALPRLVPEGNLLFPDIFQTNQLLFYERFKTYQDYMLADCKPSEVREFTAEYLEKVLEPSGWQAIWRTDVFEVLVEVTDVEYSTLKAIVHLSEPYLCESRVDTFTMECMKELLEAKECVPLQELFVVFDESGEFDQTALAIEHIRFFYQNIWRSWDDEDEDDFDYFVRCVEPRLRMHYDVLEDRVPSGLVLEYRNLLSQCDELYKRFTELRNTISNSGSESEMDNVSMVEGVKMYEELENFKQKLKLIENPLLRYVFGYQKPSALQAARAKGHRPADGKVIHVVSLSMTVNLLQSLTRDRLYPESCNDELELQFHSDPLAAVNACYEGDLVIICPGRYAVNGLFSIADSIELEGYGLPDDIVIEKLGKGDSFVDCTGAMIKISNVKFVQHDAVEGIISVHQGKTVLDNCVLQCETTGVTLRTSAELIMTYCDLYGAKGAGIEVYPGSTCSLIGNGIHHCKDGILIKDFFDEVYDIPKITLENNVIHNNEGYGVILVKPTTHSDLKTIAANDLEDGHSGAMVDDEGANEKMEPKDDATEQGAIPYQADEGNNAITKELVATSRRKSQLYKKRLGDLGITKVDDDDLMSQDMFVSIVGNQFKWNGKGCFGTFHF
ncbi:SHC SH2 domain-binding protein 1 [Ambystoma mexicanum]|uniref:SHC SH2 domain-binding protein 1 n=1 Tax=Ambystoma mexicanum TaxID=8296 RepID=UPI0037E8F213